LHYYFAVIGSICLIGAIWLFVRRLAVMLNGITTEGRIEAFETRESDDSIYYLPVVSFADHEGKQHRFTSMAGSSSQDPQVGTKVRVRYHRTNPSIVYIVSFLHMCAAPLSLAALGVCGLLAFYDIHF
jgi:hypothetical protein